MKSSAGSGITPTSKSYQMFFGLDRLRFCDQQLSELAKVHGEDSVLSSSPSEFEALWAQERLKRLGDYEIALDEVLDYLSFLNLKKILSQWIGSYRNKIYEKADPDLGWYLRLGMLSSMTCLISSGLSLIASGIIPGINLTIFTKFYEPIFISPLCLTTTILFLLAAYVCNVAFLFGLVNAVIKREDDELELSGRGFFDDLSSYSANAEEIPQGVDYWGRRHGWITGHVSDSEEESS